MTENYICVCCKRNFKLQAIVSKVNNFREKWMGKDNINRQQLFRVKRTLPGADVEQRSDKQEDTCHQNSKRVEFIPNFAFRKGRLKLILQLLKKRLFWRNKVKVSRFDMLFVQIWWGFLVVCSISISEPQNVKVVIRKKWYLSFLNR